MNYYIFVTGCYQNYYDAECIAHLLEKMGYVLGTEKTADVIVTIACSVRQKPIDRIFGNIRNWQKRKHSPKIIVVGCVLPRDKKKLLEKIDAVTTVEEFEKAILSTSEKRHKVKNSEILRSSQNDTKNTKITPNDLSSDTALVPIMFGCNNFCTYCAVPYTRGRERSRDEEKIIAEVTKKVSTSKKILLLGQNVNSYNPETLNLKHETKIPFAKLLEKIDAIPGDFTFNFTSSNPHDFHESLVNTLPKLKKWERVLHLPLQSGDDEILKKMNRKYSAQDYLRLVESIKCKVESLKLTTDIIVGFPSETKEQFNNTVKLCKQIGFSKIYPAQYSPRPGTISAKTMKDDVIRTEKKHRWEIINNLYK